MAADLDMALLEPRSLNLSSIHGGIPNPKMISPSIRWR
jgi:hypothetical protein